MRHLIAMLFLVCGVFGTGLVGAAPAAPARNPADVAPGGGTTTTRPACPAGWTDFKHPLVGMEAHVPTNYWVRLRGGTVLMVEKQESPATMAWLLPFRPRAGAKAAEIADHFAKFVAQSTPQFKAQAVGEPSADRAISKFTSVTSGKPVEGKYCTLLAAGGTMAFVIGVAAPQGQLEQDLPSLQKIARSFGFTPPRGKWMNYQSPAGGFTMTLPEGWTVQSNDGRTPKDNIDWAASDPRKPLSRAFQWCPRFCSPQLMQDPLHVMRGYQPAQFRNHPEALLASLAQISQQPKLVKMNVNQPLTELFRRLNQETARLLAAVGAGGSDIVVYDCLAAAQIEGKPVLVAMLGAVNTQVMPGAFEAQLTDVNVTLRGWCAEADQFVNDSPVLEKVCSSMELSAAFLKKIAQGNEQAVGKIRETYAYMNKLDDQMRQSHWDTMDAIAEMNYDTLRDSGGYVNEKTGRIEQISPEKVVKNSRGEYVSREEVLRGVSPDSATVLRDAYSNDYMRGVYGRIEF
jgi:hypothetical protein